MPYILTVQQIEEILERSNIETFDRQSILDTFLDLDELDDCYCDDLEDEVDDLKKRVDELEEEAEEREARAERAVVAPLYSPHAGSTPDDIASWVDELTRDFAGRLKQDAEEVARWIRAKG